MFINFLLDLQPNPLAHEKLIAQIFLFIYCNWYDSNSVLVIWNEEVDFHLAASHLPIPHENEGGEAVQGGYQQVRHGHVQQEVVGNAPHGSV